MKQHIRRATNEPLSSAFASICASECALPQVRNYSYQDIISVTPAMPNYEAKIKSFFEEHIHDDEEIRYVLDGSGDSPTACLSCVQCLVLQASRSYISTPVHMHLSLILVPRALWGRR